MQTRPCPKTRSAARKYGASCSACRRRKVRCDGVRPTCQACTRNGEDCSYPQADPSVARLSNALEKAQARIRELEHAMSSLSSSSASASGSALDGSLSSRRGRRVGDGTQGYSNQLSVNEDGMPEHYGATSRFHVRRFGNAARTGGLTQRLHTEGSSLVDTSYHQRWLRSNARFQQQWEEAAHARLAHHGDGDVGIEEASTLLRIYWTWQAPLHGCVYRRCFTRDMALGGPYFSRFLLNVMYAHACRHAKPDDVRFHRFEQGEYFLRKAKQLLVDQLGQKPRVPTIQGLLILGGRQCATGKSSEGWLYTGMAIRMIKDLGLHLSQAQDALRADLEPDDLEAMKRLYISAYAWDKSISLTLGRSPALVEMPYPAHCLLDDSDNDEPWVPFYLGDSEDLYSPIRGLYTMTFSYFVEQAKIIDKIYACVYDPCYTKLNPDQFASLESELRAFHEALPTALRVDDIASESHCPPPHMFTLNILYHTTMILLYRPLFFGYHSATHQLLPPPTAALQQHAQAICKEEAARVNGFFRAYGQTFRFRNQTYLTSFCVYTAATIEVLQVRDADPDVSSAAVERLGTTLRMLEAEALQTPGIRRSVDIIRAQLADVGDPSSLSLDGHPPFSASPLTSSGVGSARGNGSVGTHQHHEGLARRPLEPRQLEVTGGDSSFAVDLSPQALGSGSDWMSWLEWYMADAGAGFNPALDVGSQTSLFAAGDGPNIQ